MQLAETTDYERFLEGFISRYKEELKYGELVPEMDMFLLYLEFKGSGKTPEQWLEEEEMS